MKRIPKRFLHSRISVWWMDPSGYINSELSEVKLSECVSEGTLVVLDKERLILRTSLYTGSQVGDYTIIHPSLVRKCSPL